jgi:hypothetical protein
MVKMRGMIVVRKNKHTGACKILACLCVQALDSIFSSRFNNIELFNVANAGNLQEQYDRASKFAFLTF